MLRELLKKLENDLTKIGLAVWDSPQIVGDSGALHTLDIIYTKKESKQTGGIMVYFPNSLRDLCVETMVCHVISRDTGIDVSILSYDKNIDRAKELIEKAEYKVKIFTSPHELYENLKF